MSQPVPTEYPSGPLTLESAKKLARDMARYAADQGVPCAFEVVARNKGRGPLEVQTFGTHVLFKTHKLLHVEPIPVDARKGVPA